jgi:hypothetical protein
MELLAFQKLNRQALYYAPTLLGYKVDRQVSVGRVPGGFLTFLVWKIVPGLCLGDQCGRSTQFGP